MDCAPARLGVLYIGWRAEVYQCPHDLVEAGTEDGDGNEGKEVGGGLGIVLEGGSTSWESVRTHL